MLEATGWGLVAGSSLVIGALIGITRCPSPRLTGLVLGFGAGALISAVSFELTEEAFELGGADALAIGLALGALAFYFGDRALARRGDDPTHERELPEQDESGQALLLGAVLDGVPETAVLGTTILAGGGVGVPILAAIFLSNLPEGIAGAVQMSRSGVPRRRVLLLWLGVALVCALAAGLGYLLLEGASGDAVATLQAFAAGGVLAMLAIEMLPAAHKDGHRETGLVTVLGFATAYLLSTV